MSSRVLVTGASGYIGRNLLPELLARGHEVHAVTSRARQDTPGEEVSWHVVDLLDADDVEQLLARVQPQWLAHMAWYTEHGLYWESPENLSWMTASVRLVEAFARAGGARAVCAGTCAEYAWTESPCVEDVSPLQPATLYGVVKDATRRVLEAIAQRHAVELAWGRPFLLYGPGEDPRRLIPHVARALLSGQQADVGEGTAVRDLLHVRDVAGAFLAILESEFTGAVNVASGVGVPLRSVIELVAAEAGAPELVRFGAIPQRAGEPAELVGSSERLRGATGFSPSIGLREGIAETVDWWRATLAGEPVRS